MWPWNLFIKIDSPSTSSSPQIPSMTSESNDLLQNNGFQTSCGPGKITWDLAGAAWLARPRLIQKVWKELRISSEFEYATNSQDTGAIELRSHTEPVAYTENYSFLVPHLWLSSCERGVRFFFIKGSMASTNGIMVWMWYVPNSSHVWTLGLQLMLQFGEVIEPLDMGPSRQIQAISSRPLRSDGQALLPVPHHLMKPSPHTLSCHPRNRLKL